MLQDLRTRLSDESLRTLRAAYDSQRMAAANVTAIATTYPPLAAWAQETSATFFERPSVISAKDRERCIIALLTQVGPALSLSVHVYWGLMEGLSLDDVCQTVALVGCYGGLPKAAGGLLAVQRVCEVLADCAHHSAPDPAFVLNRLIRGFAT